MSWFLDPTGTSSIIFLGLPSPFFPRILLSGKLPEAQVENGWFLKSTMAEQNGQGNQPLEWLTPQLPF